ncbi:MAG: ribonuclease Z [Candidatus Omnitrophica bacterium]|nr:ribonuclease Z [Candidatus Omnitrophota bacterium]
MEIIFLGTNGWFDTRTGNTICTLIKTETGNIILDAGFGIAKADRYLDRQKPTYIFLSHLHLDHIAGLHALAKFRFPRKLVLYTVPGTLKTLKHFLAQPFTVPPQRLPFSLDIRVVSPRMRCSGVTVTARELVHSSRCLGYRFEHKNQTVSYCTDTGVCDNAIRLAQQADVLITECALRKGQDDEGWPHLDPTHAASLARDAGARRLVMTHFDAENYRSLTQRRRAQSQARIIFPQSRAAYDGMRVRL